MSTESSERGHLPEPEIIKNTLNAVVQVVALRRGFLGGVSSAWTGSGTIVDPKGIILTNCHVANPRAMGMPSPEADGLAIAITRRSDEPPALTYMAEIVAQSPELDLAVLKITGELNGKRVRGLDLPWIPVGNSDSLELGDTMAILGYPGIGGDTVTFTSGSVAGFTKQDNVNVRRAWIKTDATIAGGNSGGTSINHDGELVGIPTQAAAGTNIAPVDARPVVDTNKDGRIDQRDTPMSIGGFINGLRPVNLAKPLLREAGVKVTGAGARTKIPTTPPPVSKKGGGKKASRSGKATGKGAASGIGNVSAGGGSKAKSKTSSIEFSQLVFSHRVTRDGRPINATDILPAGVKQIFATVDFSGMRKGTAWSQVWALNGQPIVDEKGKWEDGPKGRKTLVISNEQGLPDGEYRLVITARKEIVAEGAVAVGRHSDDTDTELSGHIVNQHTGKGIKDALVIALKPGVRVMDFMKHQNQNMAFTSTKSGNKGQFTFPKQLPKGQAYSLIVVAKGYRDLAVESALRVNAMSPEQAQITPIPLQPE